MWIIIIVIVLFFVFAFIRGSIRATSHYKVLNSKGNTIHMGSYVECVSFVKAQRAYCKAYGIKDSFTIKRWKL